MPPFFLVVFFLAVFFFAAMFPSVVESGVNQLKADYIPQIDRATRGADFFSEIAALERRRTVGVLWSRFTRRHIHGPARVWNGGGGLGVRLDSRSLGSSTSPPVVHRRPEPC